MTDLSLGTKRCTNCGQNINQANFIIHESFCLKNIIKCELCNQPFDKNIKEEHFEEFHAKIKCECGELIEKRHIEAHKNEICKKRQGKCIYCDLTMDFEGLQEHIDYCGSRTEKCEKCKKYIQLRDFFKHEQTKCSYPETIPKSTNPVAAPKPKPVPNLSALNANNFFRGTSTGLSSKTSSSTSTRPTISTEKSFALLPCEFCNEFFTSDLLINHQNTCELNPESRNSNFGLPSRQILDMNDFLLNSEQDNDSEIDYDYFNQKETYNLNENNDNDKIPCEFCNKLFDFDSLISHQSFCETSTNELNSRVNVSPPKRTFSREGQSSSSAKNDSLINQYFNPLSNLKINDRNDKPSSSTNRTLAKGPRSIPFSTSSIPRTSPTKTKTTSTAITRPNENLVNRTNISSIQPRSTNSVSSRTSTSASSNIIKKNANNK